MSKSNINIFKKSIESTIKAISKKSDINILFGSDNKSSYQNVNLPEVNKNKLYKSKLSIRGRSDAASLINRYHDKKIHQKMSPENLETKVIFDEIEFLRCELLGSVKYPGIKKNLLDFDIEYINEKITENIKLSKPETFKLFLKNNILGLNLYNQLSEVSDPIINSLNKALKNKNIQILDKISNQKEFSIEVLKLINDVIDQSVQNEKNNNEKNDDNSEEQENLDQETKKTTEEYQSFEITDTAESQSTENLENNESLNEVGSEEESSDYSSSSSNDFKDSIDTHFKYSIYTKKFDSITAADRLCDAEEASKLRKQLDKQTEKLDSTITILANKLQRKLLSKQNRWWEFDLEEGILDSGKLARIITTPESSLSYKKEKDTEFKDTVVTLLIDNSGSMRGRPITIAAICADSRTDLQLDEISTVPISTLRRLQYYCEMGGEIAAHSALAQLALAAGLYVSPVSGNKMIGNVGAWTPEYNICCPFIARGYETKPVILITFYRSYITSADLKPIAALFHKLRNYGFAVMSLFIPSLKAPEAAAWLEKQILMRGFAKPKKQFGR